MKRFGSLLILILSIYAIAIPLRLVWIDMGDQFDRKLRVMEWMANDSKQATSEISPALTTVQLANEIRDRHVDTVIIATASSGIILFMAAWIAALRKRLDEVSQDTLPTDFDSGAETNPRFAIPNLKST